MPAPIWKETNPVTKQQRGVGRREFLAGAAAAGIVSAVGGGGGARRRIRRARRRGRTRSISTYSFWRFLDDSRSPSTSAHRAGGGDGFDGVEILRMQLDGQERTPARMDNAYLQKFKQTPSRGDPAVRLFDPPGLRQPGRGRAAEEHRPNLSTVHRGSIRDGHSHHAPQHRAVGTTRSFDDLMKNRGIEPNLPGYTDDQGFDWVILGGIREVFEEGGAVRGDAVPENHWGLGRRRRGAEDRERGEVAVAEALMDTGNFLRTRNTTSWKRWRT
jgi:hypothetical protein